MVLQLTKYPGFSVNGAGTQGPAGPAGDVDAIFTTTTEVSATAGAQQLAFDSGASGWGNSNASVAPANDSASYEGAGSIKFRLKMHEASRAYYAFGSDQSWGQDYLTIAYKWSAVSTDGFDKGLYFEVAGAGDTTIASPHTSIRIPRTREDNYVVLRIKLESQTIRSFGIRSNGELNSGGNTFCDIWLDDLRKPNVTEIDEALETSGAVTLLVPANHTPSYTQGMQHVAAADALIDMRQNVRIISNLNGQRFVRQFLIDTTGVTDEQLTLSMIYNHLSEGDELHFPANGRIRCDQAAIIEIYRWRNVKVFGHGTCIFTGTFPNFYGDPRGGAPDPWERKQFMSFIESENVDVHDLSFFGYQQEVTNGVDLDVVSGTPTNVNVTLSAGNDDHTGSNGVLVFENSAGQLVIDGVRAGQKVTTSKGDTGYILSVTATTITLDWRGLGDTSADDFDFGDTITVAKGVELNDASSEVSTSRTKMARLLKAQDPTNLSEDLMYRWDVELSSAANETITVFAQDEENNTWTAKINGTTGSSITLTGGAAPTTHIITCSTRGMKIRRRMRLHIRKAATTDVVTVHFVRTYGAMFFNGHLEANAAVVVFGSRASETSPANQHIRFYRCHFEGVSGDGYGVGDDSQDILFQDCTVRCTARQGVNLAGRNVIVRGGWISNVQRSCVDIEPAGASERGLDIVLDGVRLEEPGGSSNCISAGNAAFSKTISDGGDGIDASQLTIGLNNDTNVYESGAVIIDGEIIEYTSVAANTLTVPVGGRGARGTTAATHAEGATVLSLEAPSQRITVKDVVAFVQSSGQAGIDANGYDWVIDGFRMIDNPEVNVSGSLGIGIHMGSASARARITNCRLISKIKLQGAALGAHHVDNLSIDDESQTYDGLLDDTADGTIWGRVFIRGQPYGAG